MPVRSRATLLFLLLLPACGDSPRGGFACGATYLAGATMLLDQFGEPRRALAMPPRSLPDMLPVRVAAGPAFRGLVGYVNDSTIVVGVEGTMPEGTDPGFGVLAAGLDGQARGVMLYPGRPVVGAPTIGIVTLGDDTLPLLGIQTDLSGLEMPACPFFPDSLGRP